MIGLIGLPAIMMASMASPSLSRREQLIKRLVSKLGPLGRHKLLEHRIILLKTLLTIDLSEEEK